MATVTIFGTTAETKEIIPESIETDELTGKTYLNLQPITNEPGWRPLDTASHLPTTFTPMHQTMPECPKFLFHIDGIEHSCADTLQAQQRSLHTQDQLLPSGSKRARDEGVASSAAPKPHLVDLLQHMSLMQQQQHFINAFPADPIPSFSSRPTARMPFHQPPSASPVQKLTADAATDAGELLEHTAALRKANMLLQCCPILEVDHEANTPPGEDPTLYYLVIKNLRNPGPETRELLADKIHKTANFATMEFVKVLERRYSAYVGFRSIRTVLAVGKNLPNKIAQRNVQVCLARSKYFPTPDIMLQLIRQCTEERHLPFAITEDL